MLRTEPFRIRIEVHATQGRRSKQTVTAFLDRPPQGGAGRSRSARSSPSSDEFAPLLLPAHEPYAQLSNNQITHTQPSSVTGRDSGRAERGMLREPKATVRAVRHSLTKVTLSLVPGFEMGDALGACPLRQRSRWRLRGRWKARRVHQFLRAVRGWARGGLRPWACPQCAASDNYRNWIAVLGRSES